MSDALPHKHEFNRVAIKQQIDRDINRGGEYSGPPVPPIILAWKCKCGYKYAYDLMERKEFYERYQKTNMQEV